MNNEISEWNGYPVHGDVAELNGIVEATGFLKLDKDDIESVLSSDGENWIITANGVDTAEVIQAAINGLPCKIDKVNNLLIDFRCGNKQPKISDLSSITATLSEANTDIEVIWGMSSDETLGDSYKVILLASVEV